MHRIAQYSLNWALDHAQTYGDTDVLPIPFEFTAIRHDWAKVSQSLSRLDLHTYDVRPHRRLISPKARHGFRLITQIDPIDFLLFSATVHDIGSAIESSRVPINQNVVFSYRFLPQNGGQLFNPAIGYNEYQRSTREFIDSNPQSSHVVVTDIADFYPRIYHHRLENALQACGANVDHSRTIMRLLSGWNGRESYGIPVGTAAARLLAEASLIDIDEALLAQQIVFKRFNDDYRFFCTSYSEAYRHLAFIADVLYKNHGLTLQGQKTAILGRDEFSHRYLRSFEEREIGRLSERYSELLESLEIPSLYEQIDVSSLSQGQVDAINQMNLAGIIRDEINCPEGPDHGVVRFVLARLGQMSDTSVASDLLSNIEVLHPLIPEIVQYFKTIGRHLIDAEREEYGRRFLALLSGSVVSTLEFHRCWILSIFTNDTSWGNHRDFIRLLATINDQASRRELILALGRSHQRHWFQSQWRDWGNESHWPRRALIAGASCLSSDASAHWYRAIRSRLDLLEQAVATWAEANPF